MKIAIMSDSHDNWNALEAAIKHANENGCEVLLFAGDLIAPPGIEVLKLFKGKVHFVWGNNENEKMGITRKMDALENFTLEEGYFEGELDGVKIFMNHYPRFVELAAKSGDFDLCIHGHTHVYREEMVGNTLLLNPGEIQGYKTGKSTYVIYNTNDKTLQKFEVN